MARLVEKPALLSRLAATVWRRTRIHVATRGLLLAEPATEELAARWARGLVDAGAEQVYLAGSVDAARLSWQPGVWQTRAATALAALLWSNVLFHSLSQSSLSNSCDHERPAADGEVVGVWSIGAAAWQAPLGQIRRHVAIRCAMRIVELLIVKGQTFEVSETSKVFRSAALPPWEPPGLAVAPERHRLVLEGGVPLEPAAQIWGRQRPAWRGLPQLPAALRASAEKRAAKAHDEQYTPRGEWLGGQVTAWEAALEQLRHERLRPATGWPAVGLYQRELEALAAELQAACVTLEDWLEEAGRGFEAAAARATQARQALEALCAGFPAPTRAAVWATLFQPWRWLKIAWAYWIKLPRCAQKYLDAVYHQGQARWAEANTHVLRQAYLAMAQVTHDHQAAIKKLYVALAEAQADLARQLDGLNAPPEPWDEAQLQRLAGAMLPEVWPAAWTLADHAPDAYGQSGRVKKQVPELARSETGQSGEATGACGQLATTTLEWVEGRLGELAGWTAADCLAYAADDAGLTQRLGRLAEEALPLWPATNQEADAGLWLIWPARAEERGFRSAEERLQSSLQAWADRCAEGRVRLHPAAGSASALLVLRAAAATLDWQKQEDV